MRLGQISPGDIYHFFNHELANPGKKFHACLKPDEFLRITTKPWYKGIPITRAEYKFLREDSKLVLEETWDLWRWSEMPTNERKGQLSDDTIKRAIAAVPSIRTLAPIAQRALISALQAVLARRK